MAVEKERVPPSTAATIRYDHVERLAQKTAHTRLFSDIRRLHLTRKNEGGSRRRSTTRIVGMER